MLGKFFILVLVLFCAFYVVCTRCTILTINKWKAAIIDLHLIKCWRGALTSLGTHSPKWHKRSMVHSEIMCARVYLYVHERQVSVCEGKKCLGQGKWWAKHFPFDSQAHCMLNGHIFHLCYFWRKKKFNCPQLGTHYSIPRTFDTLKTTARSINFEKENSIFIHTTH